MCSVSLVISRIRPTALWKFAVEIIIYKYNIASIHLRMNETIHKVVVIADSQYGTRTPRGFILGGAANVTLDLLY